MSDSGRSSRPHEPGKIVSPTRTKRDCPLAAWATTQIDPLEWPGVCRTSRLPAIPRGSRAPCWSGVSCGGGRRTHAGQSLGAAAAAAAAAAASSWRFARKRVSSSNNAHLVQVEAALLGNQLLLEGMAVEAGSLLAPHLTQTRYAVPLEPDLGHRPEHQRHEDLRDRPARVVKVTVGAD
eukprot:3267243-Prymnesium_polylepis.1